MDKPKERKYHIYWDGTAFKVLENKSEYKNDKKLGEVVAVSKYEAIEKFTGIDVEAENNHKSFW